MNKSLRLSTFLSFLFHPLLMPMYGIWLLFHFNRQDSFVLYIGQKLVLFSFSEWNFRIAFSLIIFFFTFGLPVLFSLLLVRTGKIQSLYMERKEERRYPYLFTVLMYLVFYQLLQAFHFPVMVQFVFMGAILSLVLCALINWGWKISAHMIGIGSMAAIIIILGIYARRDVIYLLIPTILLAGLLGSARLKLQAHQPAEIYAGFIAGFCSLTGLLLVNWLIAG
jgi:hypothetical protein